MKEVISDIPEFEKLIDKEHTSIPNRSIALFTLSAIYHGTLALIKGMDDKSAALSTATSFWQAVYQNMPEWKKVAAGDVKASVIRKESMSPLSITIRALGEVGNEIIANHPKSWSSKLRALSSIDWSKSNPLWSEGIVVNGSVQLSHATQSMMVKVLKQKLV